MEIKKVSPFPHLDKVMERLHENKKKWVELPLTKKISYLENIRKNLANIVDDWTKESLRFKGIDPELSENSSHLAYEYLYLVPLGSYINSQLEVLKKCKEKNGTLEIPEPKLQENKHVGRQFFRMFPKTKFDSLIQPDYTIDVWLEKDKPLSQGKSLNENREGRVCVVLGGGNVNVIPPCDALHKLFVENQVVIMKYNPANANTGFWVDKLFAELIEDGFYFGVGGETEPGAYLVEHKYADTLHMTGSEATYNRIVWGHPSEWKERQKTGSFCNSRHFSCELGCVSPWIIYPGSWKEKTLKHQAKQLALAMTNNNGFICASPKVAVVAQNWKHKEEFLNYFKKELEGIPSKPGYYKGAHNRHQTFIEKYKDQAVVIKPKNFKEDHLEWVVIPELKANEGEYAFVTESFSPLICFLELPDSEDFDKFNDKVAPFCNDRLWGTLSCTVIIPDEEMKDNEEKVFHTIDQLKYGTVSINAWAGQSYGRGIWGGYPNTGKPEDIQSGIEYVFNPYMVDNLEKTVCRSPIISDAHGCKDLGNAQLKVMSRLAHYNVTPSNIQFTKILTGALAGL